MHFFACPQDISPCFDSPEEAGCNKHRDEIGDVRALQVLLADFFDRKEPRPSVTQLFIVMHNMVTATNDAPSRAASRFFCDTVNEEIGSSLVSDTTLVPHTFVPASENSVPGLGTHRLIDCAR